MGDSEYLYEEDFESDTSEDVPQQPLQVEP
jgi:hypothetical protein